jgi:homoserine dehydrogenase
LRRYHISLDVDDRPGVHATVATVFPEHDVSIETVRQRVHGSDDAELVVATHISIDNPGKSPNQSMDRAWVTT